MNETVTDFKPKPRISTAGFTLTEVLVAIAIVSFVMLTAGFIFLSFRVTENRLHEKEMALHQIQNIYVLLEADPENFSDNLALFYGDAITIEEGLGQLRLDGEMTADATGTHVLVISWEINDNHVRVDLEPTGMPEMDDALLHRKVRVPA